MGSARLIGGTVLALVAYASAEAEPQRLSGIIVAGRERVAIVAGKAGTASLVVREGDALGDERVAGIDAGGVRLEGPAGARWMMLGEDVITRAALAAAIPSLPLVDPYRRERETENNQ